jgi:hypothetical protein
MIRLRYVFLFILISALGAFALGFQIGSSEVRIAVAGASVKTWVDWMSVSSDALRPASMDYKAPNIK